MPLGVYRVWSFACIFRLGVIVRFHIKGIQDIVLLLLPIENSWDTFLFLFSISFAVLLPEWCPHIKTLQVQKKKVMAAYDSRICFRAVHFLVFPTLLLLKVSWSYDDCKDFALRCCKVLMMFHFHGCRAYNSFEIDLWVIPLETLDSLKNRWSVITFVLILCIYHLTHNVTCNISYVVMTDNFSFLYAT